MKTDPKEISFYKLTTLPIIKAAPKLIEKIFYSGQRCTVLVQDSIMQKTIDDGLWAYSTKHFIPHATSEDEFPEDQPVYITTKLESLNNSTIFIALGNIDLDQANVSKLVYMFDGNIPEQLEFARNKWKSYQNKGHSLVYWQQNLQGAWDRQ